MSAPPRVPQIRPRPPADTAWIERALCPEVPADYFPNDKDSFGAGQAKQVCKLCPVRGECLEHALAVGEWHGVWGGLSVKERRAEAALRLQRRRTRRSA